MTALALVLAALAAASPPKAPAAAKAQRLAVLPLRVVGADAAQAAVLSEVALTAADQRGGLEVIGRSDVEALLGFERQKRLLGCAEDAGCMAEIGGALGADLLLTGSLGRVGEVHRVDLRLVDARKAKVLGRFGESARTPDALVEAVERGVLGLLEQAGRGPAAVAGAPQRGSAPEAARAGKAGAPAPAARQVTFNGRPLTAPQLATLARLEQHVGQLPEGAYWYDAHSGASGRWGGPALAFLPAGLELAGPLPAEASGGGRGLLTGVFVNGRELHPVDVAGLMELVGQVLPGRWWVDAQGNYGLEGSPYPLGNLVLAAQARRQAGGVGNKAWSHRLEGITPSGNVNLAGDGNTTCVSVSGYSRCTGE